MAKPKAKRYWVGFDLGGTKMLAGLYNDQGRLLATSRKKTRASDGVKAGVERLVQTIQEVLEKGGVTADQLGGIGVGSPGPLDLDRGILLETPNLGWKRVPLKAMLERTFGCPAVIGNDVDVGTYGEYRHGAAQGARCVVGVFPGTGIGGACIYEGRIVRGRAHSCMEIGHMKMEDGGRRCGCGGQGCLETVASRLAIAADAAMAVSRGEAPKLAAKAGASLPDIRSGALAEAIKEGDTAIDEIVRRAARYLGLAVANAINLLAPDVVVLGGGLVEAMPALYRDEVGRAAQAAVMPSFRHQYKLRLATLGDLAGIAGAAALARDTLGEAAAVAPTKKAPGKKKKAVKPKAPKAAKKGKRRG